jgi:beta-mannanase
VGEHLLVLVHRTFGRLVQVAAVAATLHLLVGPVLNAHARSLPLRSVQLGIYQPQLPNDLSSLRSYASLSGRKLNIVHWYALWGGWKKEFSRADLDQVANYGATPLITWEPWAGKPSDPAWSLQSAILSGRSDQYIASWAQGMAAFRQPVLLRFAHEMHHQTYPWAVGENGNTADDYVAAWQHVHGLFEQAGATNVQWVWNPNTLGDATSSEYQPLYRSLYPGDSQVDWLGLDVYNTGPQLNWGAPYWRSFPEVLSEPYAALSGLADKPIILPEVGSVEAGGSKAAWIRDALSPEVADRFPRLQALVWFDVVKEAPWALTSSRSALEGWVSGATPLG